MATVALPTRHIGTAPYLSARSFKQIWSAEPIDLESRKDPRANMECQVDMPGNSVEAMF